MSAYGYYDIPMDQYASWSSESGYNYHIVYAQGDPSRLYISNLGITGWIDLNPTNEGMFDNVVEYQFTLLDSADLMVKADCDNDVISQVKVLPNTGSDNGLFAQIAIVSLGLLLVAGLRVYKRVGITKSQIYLLVTTKT
ncbi:LPXTG cell wall anchor domain-containing protein [Candidatus Nomurabacteria bacterium]|nr:LPXTG cell wall anchor domain-containing protein [Candidatus Nomurabacteria bacterium]